MKLNEKAWAILTEEEQLAITLFHSKDKSTWQAGEIMSKAHYKYLEIKSRGEQFLKMFTEHYKFYPKFFPDGLLISADFKKYLKLCIIERRQVNHTIKEIDNDSFKTVSSREPIIIAEVNKLKNSHNPSEVNFYNLLMDFDRWNNFRIMPRTIQEPSAFKRRNKNRHRKHLKTLTTLPPFSVREIIKRYEFLSDNKNVKHVAYMPIVKDIEDEEYEVVRVNWKGIVIKEINTIGIYVFQKEEIAEEFMEIILDYYSEDTRHCTDGQKFWPRYRTMITTALNYESLQNITPSRRYLETALRDLDIVRAESIKKKSKASEKTVD